MKVIEHLQNARGPLFSYEIVPPPRGRTVKDITEIVKAVEKFNPPWIDVTAHSAGASYNERPDGTIERKISKKRPGTIGICGIIQNRFKIDTVTYILCNGFTREETEDALIELNYLGIENLLALRGDGLNYNKKISKDRSVNVYASDLVEQIDGLNKGHFLDNLHNSEALDFCIGVAAYPEKHFEAPNLKVDIANLKIKQDKGATYAVTQMFFDNDHYFNFVKACRAEGVTIPIIPGIKILKNTKQLQTIPKNFYINFPDALVDETLSNPNHVVDIGIEWATKQVQGLLEGGVPGVHFYIMNDTDSVVKVVDKFYKQV